MNIYKELPLIKLKTVIFNLNWFLFITLFVIIENVVDQSNFMQHFQRVSDNNLDLFRHHRYYPLIKSIPILNSHSQAIYTNLQELDPNNIELRSFIYQFKQSGYIFRLISNQHIPEMNFCLDSVSRITYLTSYSILKERFLKPFIQAILPSSVLIDQLKDYQLLAEAKKYHNGKHFHIFDKMDPDVRNAIAHISYFETFPKFQFGNQSVESIQKCSLNGMMLMNTQCKLDLFLSPPPDDFNFHIAIAEIIYLLFVPSESKPISYWESATRRLSKNPDFIFLEGLCYLNISELLMNVEPHPNLKTIIALIDKANSLLKDNEDALALAWVWIFTILKKLDSTEYTRWYKQISMHFRAIPNSKLNHSFVQNMKEWLSLLI
jgi:hypothetical protein